MPLFVLIISLVMFFHIRLMFINRKKDGADSLERYLSEDYSANFTRARNIDEEMIVRLSESEFPFKEYDTTEAGKDEEELIRIQKKVKLNLGSPIIKSNIPTNTEIKKRFGLANLQTVIEGEENFTLLIQNLNKWAELLIKRGDCEDAELILEKASAIGSDISETYVLLYKLYNMSGRNAKIEELAGLARELPEIARDRVLNTINGI